MDSSWTTFLKRTRIVFDPYEIAGGYVLRRVDPRALGIFMRLLPYAVGGLPTDLTILSRFAGVSPRMMKRWWPEIEPWFERRAGGEWVLRPADWFSVQTVSVDRQRLRHLLDRLVSFWGDACVYCGVDSGELEVEHIVPVVRGGSDDLTNLTLACKPCNLRKRTLTAAEFGFPHIHEQARRIQ